MEQTIAVSVGHFGPRALVRAVLEHGHIVTGNPVAVTRTVYALFRVLEHGSGAPNATYRALVAGHRIRIARYDEASATVSASIAADHPLAEAIRLIAAAQIARRAVRENPVAESIAAW